MPLISSVPGARPDACEIVRQLGGTATRQQLLRYTTSHSLRKAVAAKQLRRTSRSIYTLPGTPIVYSAAAAAHGLVSHQSAAAHWKLEGVKPTTIAHVTVPPRARPPRIRGVTFHYQDVDGRDDHNGVTSPVRTVLDCALALPFPEALSIADSALHRDLISDDALLVGARLRRGAGRARALRVAEMADGRADNPFESNLRAIVIEAGLTGFVPQHEIHLPGLDLRVDLADPIRKIVLEADSYKYHSSRDALVRDCLRYNHLIRAGWLLLRFSWEHVMLEPDLVAELVVDTCNLR